MRFTVFTPTYNRAHKLLGLYRDLCCQTFKDFEWLIIDDGSTDFTANIISDWIVSNPPFPIRYHSFGYNRGKHIAHNYAVEMANGKFFLILDSDDGIAEFALEALNRRWEEIPDEKRAECCGVACLCYDPYGNLIGDLYPESARFSSLAERLFKYKIRGEHWGSMRTDILRQYPFPEIEGFVPEGLIWLQIAKKYKDYCVNDPLRCYYGAGPDSLSRLGITKGKIAWCRYLVRNHLSYMLRYDRGRLMRALAGYAISPFVL